MRRAAVVEIGSGSAAGSARRLLSAIQNGTAPLVKRELLRAKRVCERESLGASHGAEQAELLDALVENMGISPWGDAEVFLLGHLAERRGAGNLAGEPAFVPASLSRWQEASLKAGPTVTVNF